MKTVASPSRGKTSGSGPKKKLKFNRRYLLIPAGLIMALVFVGLMPLKGSIQYGTCRVFIEKRAIYPLYLDIISVLERPSDVRVEYTVVNEFGDTLFHTITCIFRPDPQTGFALNEVILDRRKIDQKELADFNATIPAILANPPNLILPPPMSASLMDLWKAPQYE